MTTTIFDFFLYQNAQINERMGFEFLELENGGQVLKGHLYNDQIKCSAI